jgi:hypothetical protein
MLRGEALVGLIASSGLAVAHLHEVRWSVFALFFVTIDLVGYLPGALAHRRAGGRRIAPVYPALYNITHGFATNALFALAWSLAVRPEWALVAIPIHLFGDRALFGNFFKPLDAPFARGARGAGAVGAAPGASRGATA